MRWFAKFGLRTHILLISLLVFLPLLGVVIHAHINGRQMMIDNARTRGISLVEAISRDQYHLLEEARHLMGTISLLPQIKRGEIESCSNVLKGAIGQYPAYSSMGIADLDGTVICSTLSERKVIDFSDRKWFHQIKQQPRFTVGGYLTGRISAESILACSQPIFDDKENLRFILFNGLRVSWFEERIEKAKLSANSTVFAMDPNGNILFHYPELEKWMGKNTDHSPLISSILEGKGTGFATATEADGIERLYSFCPTPEGYDLGSYVIVGMPTAEIFKKANKAFYLSLLILVSAGIFSLSAAWWAGDRFILQPAGNLLDMAGKLADGNFSARFRQPYPPGEYGKLGLAFDHLAFSLEKKENDKKVAQEKLVKSEDYFKSLIENSSDLITVVTNTGEIVYQSPSNEWMLGYTPEEVLGNNIADYIHPDDFPSALEKINQTLFNVGQTYSISYRIRHKDGSWKHMESSGRARKQKDGSVQIVVNSRNVTQLWELSVELKETSNFLETILNAIPDVIGIQDLDHRIIRYNEAGYKLLDSSIQEVKGKRCYELIGKNQPCSPCATSAVYKTKKAAHVERYDEKLGMWLEARSYPVLDERGELKFIVEHLRDITYSKMMENSLRESEEKYRDIVENAQEGIWIIDENAVTTFVNPQMAKMLGYSIEEMLGKNLFQFMSETEIEIAKRHIDRRREDIAEQHDFKFFRKDGSEIWTSMQASPLKGPDGQYAGALAMVADITQRKRSEEVIKQRADEFEVLYQAASDLAQQADLTLLLTAILEKATMLVNVDSGAFLIYDEAKNDLKVEVVKGDSITIGDRIPLGEGMAGRVAENGEARVHDRYSEWEHALPRYKHIKGAIAEVPMIYGGEIIGVLIVNESNGAGRKFSDADIRRLSLLAAFASTVIPNARLLENATSRLKQLQSLREIDMAITASLDLRVTFNIFLDQVTQRLGVDAADILLMENYTHKLSFAAGRGFVTEALKYTNLSLGEGYAGKIAMERKPLLVEDLSQHPEAIGGSPHFYKEKFIFYMGVPLIAKGKVEGVLEVFNRTPVIPEQEWQSFLEALAGQAAIAIDNATLFSDLQKSNTELFQAYDTTIEGWSKALDLRDKETEGHSQRVTELTVKIANAMGIGGTEISYVRWGALLHDIGKMGIPDSILLKPGSLDDKEWEIMKKHPVYAYELLYPIAYLRPAIEIPYCHHEKWDGGGYPRGLRGENIPLPARIFALVDVWDALRSDRPYRDAWPKEKVLKHIEQQAGKHFDPKIVEMFLKINDELVL